MSKNALVDIFAEDHAHEAFIRAIVRRISREYQKSIRPLRVRNARGGHGRVMTELKLFQRSVLRPVFDELPDLLIIAIDANCQHFAKARKEIEKAIDPEFLDRTAIACPDPHIEKWYLADPESFSDIVGRQPRLVRKKCERDRYKSLLAETIRVAGHPSILGGIEFAEDLVNAMDFYRAGKNDRSFQTFIDSLRSQFKRI
jgi:hypothetical protein